jgi:hypothetical protein
MTNKGFDSIPSHRCCREVRQDLCHSYLRIDEIPRPYYSEVSTFTDSVGGISARGDLG